MVKKEGATVFVSSVCSYNSQNSSYKDSLWWIIGIIPKLKVDKEVDLVLDLLSLIYCRFILYSYTLCAKKTSKHRLLCLSLSQIGVVDSVPWSTNWHLEGPQQEILRSRRAILHDVRHILKNIFLHKYPKNWLISSSSISYESFQCVPFKRHYSSQYLQSFIIFIKSNTLSWYSTQWKLLHDMLLDEINPFLGYL